MALEARGSGLGIDERRAAILALLDRESTVRVSQLAQAFSVSRVTARGP